MATIDGDWRRVVIPLSEFENVDRSDINNVTLQINQQPDTAGTAQIFLDDGAWVFESCP